MWDLVLNSLIAILGFCVTFFGGLYVRTAIRARKGRR
jgi:hypothetical protein